MVCRRPNWSGLTCSTCPAGCRRPCVFRSTTSARLGSRSSRCPDHRRDLEVRPLLLGTDDPLEVLAAWSRGVSGRSAPRLPSRWYLWERLTSYLAEFTPPTHIGRTSSASPRSSAGTPPVSGGGRAVRRRCRRRTRNRRSGPPGSVSLPRAPHTEPPESSAGCPARCSRVAARASGSLHVPGPSGARPSPLSNRTRPTRHQHPAHVRGPVPDGRAPSPTADTFAPSPTSASRSPRTPRARGGDPARRRRPGRTRSAPRPPTGHVYAGA